MASEADVDLLQRAGSFTRHELSGCLRVIPSKIPDISTLSSFKLPLEYLPTTILPGDASSIITLVNVIRCVMDQRLCDHALELALESAQDRLNRTATMLLGTCMQSNQVPTQHIERLFKEVESISLKVQEALGRSEDAQVLIRKLQTELDAIDTEGKARQSSLATGALLPGNLDGLGRLKEGWKDKWWQSAWRQQFLEMLELTYKQQSNDDLVNYQAIEKRDLLKQQLQCITTQLAVTQELTAMKDSIPTVPDHVLNEYLLSQAENRDLYEKAMHDVKLVSQMLEDFDKQGSIPHVCTTAEKFLEENHRHNEVTQSPISEWDMWCNKGSDECHGKSTRSVPKFSVLEREVNHLRQLLKEKEEQLSRERDLQSWNNEMACITDLEATNQTEVNKLMAVKQMLCNEQSKVLDNMSHAIDVDGQLKSQLEERRRALQVAASIFFDVANASDTTYRVAVDVQSAVKTFANKNLDEQQERAPGLMVLALEMGADLDFVLRQLDREMKEQVAASDAMVLHLTRAVEFLMDTRDPDIPKFQTFLDTARLQCHRYHEVQGDNAHIYSWLKGALLPIFKQLQGMKLSPKVNATFSRLQRQFPTFFSWLSSKSKKDNLARCTAESFMPEITLSRLPNNTCGRAESSTRAQTPPHIGGSLVTTAGPSLSSASPSHHCTSIHHTLTPIAVQAPKSRRSVSGAGRHVGFVFHQDHSTSPTDYDQLNFQTYKPWKTACPPTQQPFA